MQVTGVNRRHSVVAGCLSCAFVIFYDEKKFRLSSSCLRKGNPNQKLRLAVVRMMATASQVAPGDTPAIKQLIQFTEENWGTQSQYFISYTLQASSSTHKTIDLANV